MSTPSLDAYTRIVGYDECREVLRSQGFAQASKRESLDFVGDTVLTLDGVAHATRRRLLQPLFSRAALSAYERDVLGPTITRVLAGHAASPDPDGSVRADLVRLARTVFLQLASATIGLDGVVDQDATDRLAGYLYPLLEGVTVEWSTRDHAEVVREAAAARDALVADLFAPAWARRHAAIAAGEELTVDLLAILAAARVPHDAAVREVVLFLAASTLNNASLVTHVVDELHGWFDAHPGDRGRTGDRAFLRAAMVEALRLHVPTVALIRRATTDLVLASSGRTVAAGEEVALDLEAANRDPGVFGDDPDAFRPGRAVRPPEPGYGLVFGGGAHVCLGRAQVVGSYAEEGADTEGMLLRVLRELYAAGVRPDPHAAPQRAESVHPRFLTFPVVFDQLRAA